MNQFSTINKIENDSPCLRSEWKNLEPIMYRPNSKTKSRNVKIINRRQNITKASILDSVLPSKEEMICDILLPTIRRSIRSKLYEL